MNVNNMNKADLVKLALKKQAGKTTSANQPSYMTKNGSVFNAPNAKQTAQTKESKPTTLSEGIEKLNNTKNSQEAKSYDNIDNIKTAEQGRKAIADLKEDMQDMSPLQRALQRVPLQLKLNKLEEKQKGLANKEFEDSQRNLKSIAQGHGAIKKDGTSAAGNEKQNINGKDVSASEGRAMAKDAEKENAKLEHQTAQTKKDARTVRNFSKSSQKTGKDIKKDEAKLNKEIASESAKIKQNQAAISKESQTMEQTSTEIAALQSELQSLTADRTGIGEKSAFSLKLAGEQNDQNCGKVNANSGNSDRIAELQNQIGVKADSMSASSQKLTKLQTSTNKSITVMHNKVTLKSQYYLKTQKTIQAQQKEESGIMKVAQKIDDISQAVTTTGSVLQKVGTGMIAAGAAMSWLGGAGAALISAGKVVKQVGSVTEMVGQYGQTAANITKAACNIAEGNFAAALQSVGTAMQTGAAAIKSTNGLKDNMKAISQEAENAQTKLAAGVTARETAKQLKESGGLDSVGLTQKDARKQIQGQLLEKAQNGQATVINGRMQLTQAAPKMGADGKFIMDNNSIQLTPGNLNVAEQGGKTSFGKKIGNTFKKGVKNTGNAISKMASDPDKLMKVGKNLTAMGAKMAGGTQQAQAGNGKGKANAKNYQYPQYAINYDRLARGNKMLNKYQGRYAA